MSFFAFIWLYQFVGLCLLVGSLSSSKGRKKGTLECCSKGVMDTPKSIQASLYFMFQVGKVSPRCKSEENVENIDCLLLSDSCAWKFLN